MKDENAKKRASFEDATDQIVNSLIEKWKVKFQEEKEIWDKHPRWPAKHVRTEFIMNGKKYVIYPETLGYMDEGFMESIQEYMKWDLKACGAKQIRCFGELD